MEKDEEHPEVPDTESDDHHSETEELEQRDDQADDGDTPTQRLDDELQSAMHELSVAPTVLHTQAFPVPHFLINGSLTPVQDALFYVRSAAWSGHSLPVLYPDGRRLPPGEAVEILDTIASSTGRYQVTDDPF